MVVGKENMGDVVTADVSLEQVSQGAGAEIQQQSVVGSDEIAGSCSRGMHVRAGAENSQAHRMKGKLLIEILSKTVPETKEQQAQRLCILLAQRPLEIGSQECNMCCERFPEQGIALLGETYPDASAIVLHIVASDQTLHHEPVQHSRQCPLGHQSATGELGTGHAVGVSQCGNHIEL